MADTEQDRAAGQRGGGEDLGGAASSEFPRDDAGQYDDRGVGERGDEPQAVQRGTKGRGRESGHERCERWLVDVSPCEVATAGEEVELVAGPSVAACDRQLDDDDAGGDKKHSRVEARPVRWDGRGHRPGIGSSVGLMSRMGVSLSASIRSTCTRVPSTAKTVVWWRPIGFGRSGERVVN